MAKIIGPKEIEHLAQLSRLDLSKKEKAKMTQDLGNILDFVSELKEMDVEKEPPFLFEDQINVSRASEKPLDYDSETYLKQAPKRERQFFKVPRILHQ